MKKIDLDFGKECMSAYEKLTEEEKIQTWNGVKNITEGWITGKVAQKVVYTGLLGIFITVVGGKVIEHHRRKKAKKQKTEVL